MLYAVPSCTLKIRKNTGNFLFLQEIQTSTGMDESYGEVV